MKKIQRLTLVLLALITTLFLPSCETPLMVVQTGGSGGQGPMRPMMPMHHQGGGGYGGEQPRYYQPNGGYGDDYNRQQPQQFSDPVTPYKTYGSRNGSVAHWGPAQIQEWNGRR